MKILLLALDQQALARGTALLRRRYGADVTIARYVAQSDSDDAPSLAGLAGACEPDFDECWQGLLREANAFWRDHLTPLFAISGTNILEGAFARWYQFEAWPMLQLAWGVRRAIELERPDRVAIACDWPGVRWWIRDDLEMATVCRHVVASAGLPCEGAPSRLWESLRGAVWWLGSVARGLRHALSVLRCKRPGGTEPVHSERPVLFVGYAAPQSDVARALAETLPRGLQEAVLFSPTGKPEGKPWPCMRFPGHYWTRRGALRGLGEVTGRIWSWRNRRRLQSFAPLCEKYRLPFAPLRRSVLRVQAAELGPGLLCAGIAQDLIRDTNPRAVVVSHARDPGVAAILWAAKARGIRVGVHMHGVWGTRKAFREASAPVDFALVLGEHYADIYEACGMPRDRVQVVGRWGEVRQSVRERREVVAALCRGAQHIILALTQPGLGEGHGPGGTWLGHVLAAAHRVPGARVLIKLHPAETPHGRALYQAALDCTGADGVLIEHDTARLPDLLPVADVAVVQTSTAGLDVLAAGVPLIAVEFTAGVEAYPFVAEGAALGVRSPAQMLPQLQTALFDEPVRARLRQAGLRFVVRHAGPPEPVAPDWERLLAD